MGTDGASHSEAIMSSPKLPGPRDTSRAGVNLIRALQFCVLLCSALVMGLTLSHVLQSPGSRGLSGAEWLDVQHTFYGGFAVVGGISEFLGLVTAIALIVTLLVRRLMRAAVAPAIATVCFIGMLLSYWFGNRPVNAKIVSWTASSLPPDWQSYRDTWETAHAVTAGLAALAFVAVAVAIIWHRKST